MSRTGLNKLRQEATAQRYPELGVLARYVIQHASRQSARGRRPSLPFMGLHNPSEALTSAIGYDASAAASSPEDVLAIRGGSMFAWVSAQDPELRVEFVAVDKLRGASPAARMKFLSDLTGLYKTVYSDTVPPGETAQSLVAENMFYVSGRLGKRDEWMDAIEALSAPDPNQA